ncbi:hypothetical protein LguiA_003284 [Lonicera macranthoides]
MRLQSIMEFNKENNHTSLNSYKNHKQCWHFVKEYINHKVDTFNFICVEDK